jgi:DNA-binding MarR family transcriptional regulator
MKPKSRTKYPKFNRRHAGVLQWLLEHPAATLTECAKATGYSRSYLSRVVNNPEFRNHHIHLLDEALRKKAECLLFKNG